MIHRLPFSNLVIEDSPEVMPSNIESKPYSIQSFNYWAGTQAGDTEGTVFTTIPDRNWGAEEDEDYKGNKEQGENIFLKFVPRGPYADGIYVGVVRTDEMVSTGEDEYAQPVAYQIGVGDCDIKHRPWTDIEVSFDTNVIEQIDTYNIDGDFLTSTSSVFSSSSDSLIITSAMFDTTPALSHQPADLDGGTNLVHPFGKFDVWYVEGYGTMDVSWQRAQTFWDGTIGKIRTFWTVTEDIGEITTTVTEEDDNTIYTSYIPTIDKITSITPASAFEPPIPE
jgi:hypothetical protein